MEIDDATAGTACALLPSRCNRLFDNHKYNENKTIDKSSVARKLYPIISTFGAQYFIILIKCQDRAARFCLSRSRTSL